MDESSFTQLLGSLAAAGLREWSLPAVAGVLARSGRTVTSTGTGRFVVTPQGGPLSVEVVADPEVTDPGTPGAVYGLSLAQPGSDVAVAIEQVRLALGVPATVGGPGPWARWTTGTTWWTLSRASTGATIRVFVEPAGRAAQDESRDLAFGTARTLPYLWRVDTPAAAAPAGPTARNIEAVAGALPAVCSAVVEGLRAVPADVPPMGFTIRSRKGGHAVRCDFDRQRCSVEVDGTRAEHGCDERGAAAVADAAAAAVGTWPVRRVTRDLLLSTDTGGTGESAGGPRRLTLPGLGLTPA